MPTDEFTPEQQQCARWQEEARQWKLVLNKRSSWDAFEQYSKTLAASRYNFLDEQAERKLILEYHATKSKLAFNQLIDAHLRFVVSLLRYYKIPMSIDIMDMIQEGNEGLIRGITLYDPKKYTCRVFSYCQYWIRVKINRFLEEHAKVSRPLSHWESLDRRFRFGAQWGNKGHVYRVIESATLADLSELQGTYPSLEHDVGKITDGKAKKARKPAAPIVVYTDAAREGETNLWQYWDIFEKEFRYLKEFPGTSALSIDDSSVFETLESATPLLEAQIDDIASDILHLAEEQLTDREVAVISLYLGLKPPYVMKTLQEIGAILHIHLERVRQICRDALDKMDKDTVKTFF